MVHLILLVPHIKMAEYHIWQSQDIVTTTSWCIHDKTGVPNHEQVRNSNQVPQLGCYKVYKFHLWTEKSQRSSYHSPKPQFINIRKPLGNMINCIVINLVQHIWLFAFIKGEKQSNSYANCPRKNSCHSWPLTILREPWPLDLSLLKLWSCSSLVAYL